MPNLKNDKIERVLAIYAKLLNNQLIEKSVEAKNYGVNERTILRDIDDIRNFLVTDADNNCGARRSVKYSRAEGGYRLVQESDDHLTNSELLALCKILLDSRAFTKEEMSNLLNKLIACCAPQKDQKLVDELIRNEKFHYVEPRHRTQFINTIWDIGQAIHDHNLIEIDYLRTRDHMVKTRRLQPASILFSEYYFYLTAFIDDEKVREDFDVINDSYPTIYRIDRIQKLRVLDEKFRLLYRDRFEEGEFRKRVQFMYGGKLRKVRFKYTGSDIDAILDRLPTAQVVNEKDGAYVVEAEVFGDGIEMWIRSQGDALSEVEYLK